MGIIRKKKSEPPQDTTMSIGDHLEELRTRLIHLIIGLVIAMAICMGFGKYIIAFIRKPYIDAMGEDAILQSLAPADGFVSYMQIALVCGLILSSPWVFYQLWKFIATGLYPKEKRYVYMSLPFSVGLFITGALFFILKIAPVTLQFLVLFNKQFLGVSSNFTFSNYISFIGMLTLIFGLAFQTPIAVFVLYLTGLVTIKDFCKFRKYVFFGIIAISAAVLPGSDPFSLFAMVIPMYLLYEFGILLSWISERRKIKKSAA